MKRVKGKIEYTEEPEDDLALPEEAKILTREEENAQGVRKPSETTGLEWERSTRGNKVILKPKRGGVRPGAGRKPKGHVRMQVLVSKTAKDRIRRLARKRGVSMSAVVSEVFER